jgi:FKBP-type peptidyl-prolyl cis-trans isomerase FkpA
MCEAVIRDSSVGERHNVAVYKPIHQSVITNQIEKQSNSFESHLHITRKSYSRRKCRMNSFFHTIFARTLSLAIAMGFSVAGMTSAWAQNDVLQTAAKEPGAKVTASGLVYRSLQDGQGASPAATDKVKVHYRGTFPDGKEFDSSYKRNKAIEFPLNGVIPCWTEGVQLMKIGGKAKLTCPPAIAYGARGAGGVIPPNATLLFEVELIAIAGK